MKKLRYPLLYGVVIVLVTTSYPVISQNCNQSFFIDSLKKVPELPLSPFAGWSCRAVEDYRQFLYIENKSKISEKALSDLDEWRKLRDQINKNINNARNRIENAKSDREVQAIAAVLLHEVGMAISVLGCSTTPTGMGAVACVGGVTVTKLGLIWSLATINSTQDAREALLELQQTLEKHENLSQSELDEAQSIYEVQALKLCDIVRSYCK
ncbi:hypothetical protein [Photobacterium galatheae]|uniref:Uncharacterized protein n=1 Tax=Photobacterium galatheae TaxID=1654360 RepID=A0A066RKI3_9GAMM|nr:hypothetical protein [Photobacterium galatheae]KDM89616.1 hypothetical protein EA58_21655 [Photobacterium galatheae]MCM0151752.1 hypothetical protein [Photobacterium galatheae]